MNDPLSRRQLLAAGGAALGAAAVGTAASTATAAAPLPDKPRRCRFCLNTGTLRGYKLPPPEEAAIAAKAGYSGIEPWLDIVNRYVEQGGSLADLRKRIADLGLSVEGAIGFTSWCGDDDKQRAKGLEQMKRDMDVVAQLGGRRIAATPAGGQPGLDLRVMGERYRTVLELGRKLGVTPQLEIWGTSKVLSRPSQAAFAAIEADDPDACLLLDVFHIYRSGAGFRGLKLLSGPALHVLHMNDYPADPPREKATDADRIFPGDGIAPLVPMLNDLRAAGFGGVLSLELFNREYWKQDPLWVAKTGLEKLRGVVQKAEGGT